MDRQILDLVAKALHHYTKSVERAKNDNDEDVIIYKMEQEKLKRYDDWERELLTNASGNKEIMEEINKELDRTIVGLNFEFVDGDYCRCIKHKLIVTIMELEDPNKRHYIYKRADSIKIEINEAVDDFIYDYVDGDVGRSKQCTVNVRLDNDLVKTNTDTLKKFLEDEYRYYGYNPEDDGFMGDDDEFKTFVNIEVTDIDIICPVEGKSWHEATVTFKVHIIDEKSVKYMLKDSELIGTIEEKIANLLTIETIDGDQIEKYYNKEERFFTNLDSNFLEVPDHIVKSYIVNMIENIYIGKYKVEDYYYIDFKYFEIRDDLQEELGMKYSVVIYIKNKTRR